MTRLDVDSERVFYISHPGGIVFKFHWAGRAHRRKIDK